MIAYKKPSDPPKIAVIREDECIGCMKCIQACPFDSIIGATKLMHTVIRDICTGCELCVDPCPVDCIDIISLPEKTTSEKIAFEKLSRERFEKRNARLAKETVVEEIQVKTIKERQDEIQAILKRIRKRA